MLYTVTESEVPTPKKFQFVAGALCLDFCNTMGGKREGVPSEKLHSYGDFLSWCEQAGVVNSSEAAKLIKEAAGDPATAGAVLADVIGLREAVYRIVMALITQAGPAAGDLAVLNRELSRALGRLRLSPRADGPGLVWGWAEEPGELASPLGPIAHSAANLLAAADVVSHVHACGGDNCGWLFLDSSRNHSRRWCDMRDCGNRAKVRRHRRKQQSDSAG